MKNLFNFDAFLNEKKLHDMAPEMTVVVLELLKKSKELHDADVTPYTNGRENGHHISLNGRAVSFSENRNSDHEVVYWGDDADFDEEGTISEEKYKSNTAYFDANTNPSKIVKSIEDFLMGVKPNVAKA